MISPELLAHLRKIFEYSHSSVSIKDSNLRYQYMNNVGLTKLELDEDEILNHLDKETHLYPYADIYNTHDRSAMQEIIYYQLEDCLTKTGEKIFAITHKLPLIDETTTNIEGVLCFSKYMNYSELISTLSSNKPFNIPSFKVAIDTPQLIQDKINLSTRELDVLYHFIQGKSAKNIAYLLKISERTVVFHINNIKQKWECNSKDAIFTKALEKGLMKFSILWDILSSTDINTQEKPTSL